MDSFIFNTFKQNLLEGTVPSVDRWYLYPVNKKFSEEFSEKIPYLKNTFDMGYFGTTCEKDYYFFTQHNEYRTTLSAKNYVYKAMYEVDNASEPEYVTSANFESFNERNNKTQNHLSALFFIPDTNYWSVEYYVDVMQADGNIEPSGIPRGFYYVKTAEELLWCANKVNGTNYDNKINIVLGDNIGKPLDIDLSIDNYQAFSAELKKINFSIGSNPAQPFNGVFYGNGFKICNIELECNNDVNGIVGYLGPEGKISTIAIDGFNVIKCNKKLNIDHLSTNGTNIYAGFLCGKNNGNIENVFLQGSIVVNQFVPSMYSMSNKTDIENEDETNAGMYYPDYLCYDSIGNIIPYIGYFNEGVFATFSGYRDGTNYYYWNTHVNLSNEYKIKDNNYTPLEWYYWTALTLNNRDGYYMHFTSEKNRVNILWYDSVILDNINRLEGYMQGQVSDNGLFPFPNTTDILSPNNMGALKYAQYLNKSIKLSQQNRLAYYVSPLIGMNNSNVTNVRVNSDVHTSGTFVGFLGGIAGMQSHGVLTNVRSNISAYDVFAKTNTDKCYYERDFISTKNYFFPQKSIKNISSLFGSCVVGSLHNLWLNSVYSHLMNYNNIAFDGTNNKPLFDDYYLLNKFGAFAAVVEYNTSNISDMWRTSEQLNTMTNRSIVISDSYFEYDEETSANRDSTVSVTLKSPYEIEKSHIEAQTDYRYKFGIASPLIAEIKPTYQAIPSIITTLYPNIGHYISESLDEITKYYRVGLFTMDQNLASPSSNPNFWGMNVEVDLPGVANGYRLESGEILSSAYVGAAGGVVDRLNVTAGINFDLNIRKMASKLIYWNNSYTVVNDLGITTPLTTIKVPIRANIEPARWAEKIVSDNNRDYVGTGDSGHCGDYSHLPPDGAIAVGENSNSVYDYAANKIINTYSYFGSDIELDLKPDENITTDLMTFDKPVKYKIDFRNPLYYVGNFEKYGLSAEAPLNKRAYAIDEYGTHREYNSKVANNVEKVRLIIDTDAFNYQPFTDTTLPHSKTTELYDIKVLTNNTNGNHMNSVYSGWILPEKVNGSNIINLRSYFGNSFASKIDYNKLKCASGFVFKVDESLLKDGVLNAYYKSYSLHFNELSAKLTNYFVIPFNVSAYDVESDGAYPPYSTFEGFYVTMSGLYHTRYYSAFDGTTGERVELFEPAAVIGFMNYFDMFNHQITYNEYPNLQRNYLQVISADIVTPKLYFKGIDPVNNEPIYVEEKPELTTAYLSAYRWTIHGPSYNDGEKIYGFWMPENIINFDHFSPTPVAGSVDGRYYYNDSVSGTMIHGYTETKQLSAYYYSTDKTHVYTADDISAAIALDITNESNNYETDINDIITARYPNNYPTDINTPYKFKGYGHIYPDDYLRMWARTLITYEDKGFEIEKFDDISSDVSSFMIKVSAVPLEGIPSAQWNWQTDWDAAGTAEYDEENLSIVKSDYYRTGSARYARKYNYEYETIGFLESPAYKVSGLRITKERYEPAEISATLPKTWRDKESIGEFYNGLVNSENTEIEQLQLSTDSTVFEPINFSGILTAGTEGLIKSNVEQNYANSDNLENNENVIDWFKYTYYKVNDPITMYKIALNVHFDAKNNKRGFWFSYADYLNRPTSGELEYNDDVHYYSNVLAIGKTLSENSLTNKCLQQADASWTTSGFAADDFDGLYVTDSADRPVMYIDVGLGECLDGTSWSLDCYPSTSSTDPEDLNVCSGLLLEIE